MHWVCCLWLGRRCSAACSWPIRLPWGIYGQFRICGRGSMSSGRSRSGKGGSRVGGRRAFGSGPQWLRRRWFGSWCRRMSRGCLLWWTWWANGRVIEVYVWLRVWITDAPLEAEECTCANSAETSEDLSGWQAQTLAQRLREGSRMWRHLMPRLS